MAKTNVIDINMSATDKRPVRFSKDDSRIVYLNIADTNVLSRFSDAIDKIEEVLEEVSTGIELTEDAEDVDVVIAAKVMLDTFNAGDAKLRDIIDEIFNAPVSAAAAPDGLMFDVFNGEYRFEHILTALMEVYEDNIGKEYETMIKNLRKHTEKYTKGNKK